MGYGTRAIGAGLLALATGFGALAHAAPPPDGTTAAVRIEGFDVEEVEALAPGTRLAFTLFGTPGGEAQVRIEGAEASLRLRETRPGIYDGTYTIGPRERIDARGPVMGSLRIGDAVARARLEEPLVLPRVAAMGVPPLAAEAGDDAVPSVVPAPRVVPAPSVPAPRVAPVPRDEGPPIAAAPPSIESEPEPLPPTYAPPANALPPAYSPPRNALPSPFSQPRRVPPPPWSSPRPDCRDCAVVESVQATRAEPRPGAIGALIGGVTGAILGDRLADRAQRHWARVAGAIGGALAGRAIERQSAPVRYDVWLRWPDGTRELRSYTSPPPYRAGDVVRVPAVVALAAPGGRPVRD